MSAINIGLSRGNRNLLIIGGVLLLSAFGGHSWAMGLIGLGLLALAGRQIYTANTKNAESLRPWPWPAEFRSAAEDMARPVDPTPKRILPPDEKASTIAGVATTKEALARLLAEKPHAWPWALFTSVLVQRRNAVQTRLRNVVSGYQPRPGLPPCSGRAYSQIAHRAMMTIADLCTQIEQFMLSPAFKGAFGEPDDENSADADAIAGVANRLMEYHEALLVQAETCVQTPVERDALVFVQDMGAFTLQPLVGFERFIATMCARIGEAQDLLPYTTGGVIQLDDVSLTMELPDDLTQRIVAQVRRFTA